MANLTTTTRNVQRDKLFFREQLCKSGGAPSWVEPVACPVLSRSSFGVDAQQLVAVGPVSRVRRGLRISGANVNEEQNPQVPSRKFLDEEERLSICRHKHPFTSICGPCFDVFYLYIEFISCLVALHSVHNSLYLHTLPMSKFHQ